MKKWIRVWMTIGCLLLATFASAQVEIPTESHNVDILQNMPTNIQEAEPGCGDSHTRFRVQQGSAVDTSVPIAPGQARVYVIEDPGWMYGYRWRLHTMWGPTIHIGLDGKWVGATKENSYLVFSVAAGKHHLCSRWKTLLSAWDSLAALEARPGETYYFRAGTYIDCVGDDGCTDYFDLELVNADEGKLLLAESVPAAFTRN